MAWKRWKKPTFNPLAWAVSLRTNQLWRWIFSISRNLHWRSSVKLSASEERPLTKKLWVKSGSVNAESRALWSLQRSTSSPVANWASRTRTGWWFCVILNSKFEFRRTYAPADHWPAVTAIRTKMKREKLVSNRHLRLIVRQSDWTLKLNLEIKSVQIGLLSHFGHFGHF